MAKRIKKTPAKSIEKPYTAEIKMFGKIFSSQGYDVKEAISNLGPVGKIMGTGVISVFHGEEKKDKILTTTQLFRLFNGGRIMKEIALKNTTLLFGNL